MVNRYVEEALYLVGMKVHRHQTVNAGHTQQVCNELGSYAHARFVLAVLTCPSEVGNNGSNRARGGTLGSINHQEQLHEIVRVGECALNQEDVASADRFLVGNGKFSVRELGHNKFAERATQACADFLCKIPCSGTREYKIGVFHFAYQLSYVSIL